MWTSTLCCKGLEIAHYIGTCMTDMHAIAVSSLELQTLPIWIYLLATSDSSHWGLCSCPQRIVGALWSTNDVQIRKTHIHLVFSSLPEKRCTELYTLLYKDCVLCDDTDLVACFIECLWTRIGFIHHFANVCGSYGQHFDSWYHSSEWGCRAPAIS